MIGGAQFWLAEWYLWLKALHIVAVISWMAGLLYLPRLYVYHAERGNPGTELGETLKVMERRLLRAIMNPAMISVWLFGLMMLGAGVVDWSRGWPWAKAALVLAMTWFHHVLARWRKDFDLDRNTRPGRTFRLANEVPTALMIGIVLLAVTEPF